MALGTYIRAYPRNAATGAIVPIRLAGGATGKPYHDGAGHYMAGIVTHPSFEAKMSFDDSGWTGRVVPTSSALSFKPADPSRLDILLGYYWRDAAIEVDRINGPLVTRRLTGVVADATIAEGGLVITAADLAKSLDKPPVSAQFAGTGGIEGGIYAIGRPKRRSLGRVFNIEGRLLDQAYNIYEFGDPARPLLAFDVLRDKGRAGATVLLEWQGSIADTFAALRAAVAPQGGGVVAPSIACAKWWTQPAGPLTANLRGETGGGYAETVAGVAAQLLASEGGPVISNLAASIAARPGPAGLHIRDVTETAASALDRLLQRVTLIWQLGPDGFIEILPWTFDAPVEALRAEFISRERTIRPISSRRVGYQRNERLHGDGEISIALSAGDILYNDGTPVEDRQPAEAGADVTGNHTALDVAHVAGVAAAEVIEQADINTESALANGLRQDELTEVMNARTLVEGQPVSTKFLEFRNAQTTENSASASNFALLGAATPDGTAWNLNLDAVKVSPTQSFAQKLTEIGLTTDQVTATAAFLLEVLTGPDGTEARAVIRVDAYGNMASIVTSAGEEISRIGLIADQTVITKPDGTVLAAFGIDGDLVYIENLKVGHIDFGAMDPEFNAKKVVTADQISQEFPGGLIMKTGSYKALIGDETSMSIVFDAPFPVECRSFIPVPRINAPSNFRDLWIQIVGDPTRFGATIQTQSSTSNNNNIDGFHWTAWGF
ncbi:gp53-like domain-containing protein [Sphingobium aromaticiconvertens]|uniref:gp53-like domain-containing protein n=1 Tax=Sphingobium aromaticiconvertens TaxID=365341 RepID=UPI0030172D96